LVWSQQILTLIRVVHDALAKQVKMKPLPAVDKSVGMGVSEGGEGGEGEEGG